MFLTGAPFTVAVIQIPLKFQAVHGVSPLGAGVRLLPFAVMSPIGSGFAAGIAGKAKIPPIYIMLAGSVVQIVGFALLSISPTSQHINNAQYAYEAIAGSAVGVNLVCLILMTPFTVEIKDQCNSRCNLQLKRNPFFHLLIFVHSRGHEHHNPIPHHGRRNRSCHCHCRHERLHPNSICKILIAPDR